MTTTRSLLSVLLAAALGMAVPAFAKKGDDDHPGKGHKSEHKAEKEWDKAERKADHREMKAEKRHAKDEAKADRKARREDIRLGSYFDDGHRSRVRTYYSDHYHGGKACPPGLAKKNNGCLPPGQARKYAVGQPLKVSYYSVPRPVLVTLPPAPVGYRYVTVNGDILLVAVGTMMVIDALTGLL